MQYLKSRNIYKNVRRVNISFLPNLKTIMNLKKNFGRWSHLTGEIYLFEVTFPLILVSNECLTFYRHTSHTSTDILDLLTQNAIVLPCLPKHSTHFLQQLGPYFFKSLKHFWREACQRWMNHNYFPSNPRKLGLAQLRELLISAWKESTTAQNAIVSF